MHTATPETPTRRAAYREYLQLLFTERLDDVDATLSHWQDHGYRIAQLEERLGRDIVRAHRYVERNIRRIPRLCSGASNPEFDP